MNLKTTIVAGLWLCTAWSSVFATVTTNWFQGTIDSYNDPGNTLGITGTNQSVQGYFTFDNDPAAHSVLDRYRATILVQFPQATIGITSDYNYIRAKNGTNSAYGPPYDYFFHGYDPGPLLYTRPYQISDLRVEFIDNSSTLFASDPPLPYSPRVCDFDTRTWGIRGRYVSNAQVFTVSGRVITTSASQNCFSTPYQPVKPLVEIQGNSLKLSWNPVPGITINRFQVERTTHLSSGFWLPLAVTPVMENGRISVSIPHEYNPEYYRVVYY